MPSQASLDLLVADVLSTQQHFAHNASILVALFIRDLHGFAMDQLVKGLLGLGAESLGFFRGVNALQSDLVLGFFSIQKKSTKLTAKTS